MEAIRNQVVENKRVIVMWWPRGARTQKDVKNAESSDYLYENRFEMDKVSGSLPCFLNSIAMQFLREYGHAALCGALR